MGRSPTISLIGSEANQFVKLKTSLSILVNPRDGVVPYAAQVSGWLKTADGKIIPEMLPIEIYLNDYLYTTVYTSVDPQMPGYYEATVTIVDIGSHQIYARFAGNENYEGC